MLHLADHDKEDLVVLIYHYVTVVEVLDLLGGCALVHLILW